MTDPCADWLLGMVFKTLLYRLQYTPNQITPANTMRAFDSECSPNGRPNFNNATYPRWIDVYRAAGQSAQGED
ncbi:MAG: hypothetical protein EA370_15000 [Wenzhouxiangella sp.]|nr:MAG: hypothetical protein EA370_15000 [Wenzhouxiangella sp.]